MTPKQSQTESHLSLPTLHSNESMNINVSGINSNNLKPSQQLILQMTYLIIMYTDLYCILLMDITWYKTDCICIPKLCYSDIVCFLLCLQNYSLPVWLFIIIFFSKRVILF